MMILWGAHAHAHAHSHAHSMSILRYHRGNCNSCGSFRIDDNTTTDGGGEGGRRKGRGRRRKTAITAATPTTPRPPPYHHLSTVLPDHSTSTRRKRGGVAGSRSSSSFLPSVSGMSSTTIYSTASDAGEPNEPQVAKGYTLTQFCDRMIEVFLHDKPQPKDWRKLLIFRDEWRKYSQAFYTRCKLRADAEEENSLMKQKLIELERKVRKIDHEMERHSNLLNEIQQNPTDINAIVARRRKDFTGDFFHHLNILSEVNDSLEDRDVMTRLGAKCLSAVSAYDSAAENLEMLETAQSKFDDILNSPSLDVACEKIKSLAKAKELDSSLVLLINRSWAAAKESPKMKSAVKDIMYHIYRTTKSSLKSIAPKEIKLLKYLLNITDPEERFSALASAFAPGDEHEVKDKDFLYSTPKELHKWIKIMLDAYQLNKEETDLREARNMTDPVVIQRLFILQETIEEEYLKRHEESKEAESKE